MNELLSMSVREMARRIRRAELSPVEVVEAHLARIEEVNPKINAVVVPRFEEARKEAQAAAERLAKNREDLPPLFGVPCTIKDTFALKGYPWAAGVWARRNLTPDFDATVVERVKQAGAIILGKTNVPEAAMWCETYNHVYGRTKNPYDLSRGVGGSSGGEGAIVAAGGSPLGIGSDIGGSIRYPSAFNGVPGHKPSGGLVPGFGHFPDVKGPLLSYCCYGPLCRRVEDLAFLLPLLAGPDGKDPATEKVDLQDPEKVDLKKVKVYWYDYNGLVQPSDEVRRAVALAAGALVSETTGVEYWSPEGIEYAVDIWAAALYENPTPFIRYLEGEERIKPGRELLRLLARRSKLTFPALGTALIETPGKLLRRRNQAFLGLAAELRERLSQKLGDNGIIICPVFTQAAPKHTAIWLDLFGISYSCLYNILLFPSTIIPIFHRPDGLPVSVQIVAARFHDHLTLAVARRLEEIFGGWKPPAKVG